MTRAAVVALVFALPIVAHGESDPRIVDLRVSMEGTKLHFAGRLEDPAGRVVAAQLRYRAVDTEYQSAAMSVAGGKLTALVEASAILQGSSSIKLLYYVVGTDDSGKPCATAGSESEPVTVFVTEVFDPAELRSPATATPLPATPRPAEPSADPPQPAKPVVEPPKPAPVAPPEVTEATGPELDLLKVGIALFAIAAVAGGGAAFVLLSD